MEGKATFGWGIKISAAANLAPSKEACSFGTVERLEMISELFWPSGGMRCEVIVLESS